MLQPASEAVAAGSCCLYPNESMLFATELSTYICLLTLLTVILITTLSENNFPLFFCTSPNILYSLLNIQIHNLILQTFFVIDGLTMTAICEKGGE